MNSAHAAALAIVVILNWLLAHLATDWAMPPEVQSALQALISIGLMRALAPRAESPAVEPPPSPLPTAAPAPPPTKG